ncbi:MAG: hypothetical protein NT028_08715 [candidate division Zixibacteria bacterium]|jgi:hypothetical protein|nr:hypothetical protein [candidate division Zixibacteria bacterium]
MSILTTVGEVPIVLSVVEFIYGGVTDIKFPAQSIILTDFGGYEERSTTSKA